MIFIVAMPNGRRYVPWEIKNKISFNAMKVEIPRHSIGKKNSAKDMGVPSPPF